MTSEKKVKGVFEIQFVHVCAILKLVPDSKRKCVSLNAENGLIFTLYFIVAYAHEKINILVSVSSIIFFFFSMTLI